MRSALLASAAAAVALLASAAAAVALLAGAPAHAAPPVPPPPYIDRTQWVPSGSGLSSLHVYPTQAGRVASTEFVSPNEAWREVLADTPDADTPGMRAQFACHWVLAEAAEPGKVSWNLEPWRPVVDDATMFSSGCNPGGPEEPS
ncbi:DUF2599 domain-containing protein [Mycobacterium sp.]|uniref:DUF2599 domain-containing protein n=1 Tax=Mycobacterium sp. TaxID=1785 RepID=UPI002CD114E8|nr:DUF2599 domain-containing protein [Mycobacterium sp.]HME50481.1 DUF2599 domain-containing protein [Mycobacterium sp.]